MTTFKPTDEQLFDYHLGIADPQLTRQIDEYLESHPEVSSRLREFDQIEQGFKNFPITEPKEALLEQVRETAAKYAKPSIFNFFKSTVVPRKLAWTVMIFVVVGLSFALQELRDNSPYEPGLARPHLAKTNNGEALENGAANFSGSLTEKALNPINVDIKENKIFQEYTKALSLYHQSRFKEASEMFNHIIAANPSFAKRVELYSYWIKTLDQMGEKDKAEQKRLELEKIRGVKEAM